jgi:hypothetical protein
MNPKTVSWMALLSTVLGALATAFTPQVSEFLAKNPLVVSVIVGLTGILNHFVTPVNKA